MENIEKYFKRASKFFLVDALSYEEYNSRIEEDIPVGLCADYGDWNEVYLRDTIEALALEFAEVVSPDGINIRFSEEDIFDLQAASGGENTVVFTWNYHGIDILISTGEETEDEA
jgi:hypothetical protein